MKKIFLMVVIMTSSLLANAQSKSPEFGTCFSKANKNSIAIKMDNFMNRVSEETGCAKDSLTYTVFYSKKCRHLPKRITFNACGEKRTYKHNGLSGAILYWLLGSWTLDKK